MGTEATAVIVKPYNEFIRKWLEEGYIIPIDSVGVVAVMVDYIFDPTHLYINRSTYDYAFFTTMLDSSYINTDTVEFHFSSSEVMCDGDGNTYLTPGILVYDTAAAILIAYIDFGGSVALENGFIYSDLEEALIEFTYAYDSTRNAQAISEA